MSDGKVIIDTRLSTKNLKKDINSLPNQLQKMSLPLKKISMLIASAFSIKKLVDFGKQAVELASNIDEVQNVVDTAFGSMTQKMEDFAKTSIETYGISKLTAKNMASTYTAMARGMGQSLDKATDNALEMTGRMADIASFYNLTMDRANTIGRAVYSGETEPLKQIGVIMTEEQLSAFALAKGYDTLYKKMDAAQKLEVRQAYFLEQTNLAAGDFVKTQDSWANQTRMLSERWKEFSATLGSTVIPTIKPLIRVLSDAIGRLQVFADAINKVFNTKTQTSPEHKINNITESTEDLTDATNKQLNTAKKLVANYDELNLINSQDDENTTINTEGIVSVTESLKQVEQAVDNTTSKIEEFLNLFKTGDYTSIGTTISDKLKEQLNNIDWDSIYTKSRNFGINFAKFLNGLFNEGTFSSVSHTIASLLNTAVENAVGFMTNFNFENFGTEIANAINEFFQTFNFTKLTKGINAFLNGIIDMVSSFMSKISFSNIVKALGDIIKNLDWTAVVNIMSTIIAVKWIGRALSVGATKIANNFQNGLMDIIKTGLTGTSLGIASALAIPLTAGIGYAIKMAQEEADYWENYRKWLVDSSMPTAEWQKRIDELAELTKGLVEESNRRISQLGDIDVEYKAIKNMSDRYFELADKQNKSNEELAEMQGLHDTLISKYPELKTILDDEKTSYKKQKEEVTKLISELERKAKMKAAEELLTQAYKDQIIAEENLKKATENYNTVYKDLNGVRDNYMAKKDAYEKQLERVKKGHLDEADSLITLKKEMDDALEKYSQTSANILGTRKEMKKAEQAYNDIGVEIKRYSDIYKGEISSTAKSVSDSASNFANAGKNLVSGLISGINDTGQKTALRTTSDSIRNLIERSFNNSSDFVTFGKNILDGLQLGLSNNSKINKIKDSISGIVDTIQKAFTKPLRINSPSKLSESYGMFFDDGLVLGVDKNKPKIKKSVADVANLVATLGMPEFAGGTMLPQNSTITSLINTGLDPATNSLLSGLSDKISDMNTNGFTIQVDGRTVLQIVRDENNKYKKMTGVTAI